MLIKEATGWAFADAYVQHTCIDVWDNKGKLDIAPVVHFGIAFFCYASKFMWYFLPCINMYHYVLSDNKGVLDFSAWRDIERISIG